MRTVRLITEEELDRLITISTNAYPGMDAFSQVERGRFRDRLQEAAENPNLHLYASFEDEEMRGIMYLYDFTMKFLSTKTLVGGVGGVAVDLLHKKEKVAANMLRFFLQYYREQGACLTALYPFRPDFYKRMGFGYGTKMNTYRFKPDKLFKGASKSSVVFLTELDRNEIHTCYNRALDRSNGLIERFKDVFDAFFANPSLHIIGVKEGSVVKGYLVYKFEKGIHDNFLSNNLMIQELIYDNPDVLHQLLTFLHSQADQIEEIVFSTQDDDFHFLLQDPRYGQGNMLPLVIAHESNIQGIGLMYRVIDVPRLFEILSEHNFGGVTCRLKMELSDSFLPQNEGEWVIHFSDGRSQIISDGDYDVAMKIDVSEFSSIITGAVGFAKLHEYGLVSISDEAYVPTIEKLFAAPKPVCLTRF